MTSRAPLPARFVARENRFVARVLLDAHGAEIRAHVPNTARLTELLVPDARVLVEPSSDPNRRTRFTLTRVMHRSTLVSLEAAQANRVLESYLHEHGGIGPLHPVMGLDREVAVGNHRFDLRLDLGHGASALVEVKSLSRAVKRAAPLSATPSVRGGAHLAALSRLAAEGERVAVVFVVQRNDVDRLVVGPRADTSWRRAVVAARSAGVEVLAVACEVAPTSIRVSRELEVTWPGTAAREDTR